MHEDRYNFWHDALSGKPDLTISQNDPMPGYYRTKRGEPVAIWDDENLDVVMMIGSDTMVAPGDYEDVWTRCCTRPVTEEQWQTACDNGWVWFDMDPAIAETLGDNIRNASDPEAILALIELLDQASRNYSIISDDDAAARAQTIRTRALELKGRADKIRETEKAPHLAAGRAVDATWQPLVKAADQVVGKLRGAMERWETEKLRERRKAEELARIAAEEAAKAKGGEVDMSGPDQPEPDLKPKPVIKGGYGRAASVGSRNVVTDIDNITEFCTWLYGFERKTLMIFLYEQAQKAVNAGQTPPGITVEEQAYVR
jgi:hypothetical protein